MKKYFVIAALLLTTGLIFAFQSNQNNITPGEKVKPVTQLWYDFTGTDENDPNSYTLRNPQTAPPCDIGTIMCAVKAEPHSTLTDRPDLSDGDKEVRRED